MKHNVEPDQEDKRTGEEDSEQESLNFEEIAALQAQNKSFPTHLKHTLRQERKADVKWVI